MSELQPAEQPSCRGINSVRFWTLEEKIKSTHPNTAVTKRSRGRGSRCEALAAGRWPVAQGSRGSHSSSSSKKQSHLTPLHACELLLACLSACLQGDRRHVLELGSSGVVAVLVPAAAMPSLELFFRVLGFRSVAGRRKVLPHDACASHQRLPPCLRLRLVLVPEVNLR